MRDNSSSDNSTKPRLFTSLLRALNLRCPICGSGRLFRNWLRMHERCSICGLRLDRGPGYYLGSIYINYGLTAVFVTAGFLAMFFSDIFTPQVQLIVLASFCVLFPLWFFRYARSLWLAMDLYFDPGQLTDDD
jgi:uncharacterized protein (DUF983 family)